MWKLRKFALTIIWEKFRENNVFTIEITEITKELIRRDFFAKINFLFAFGKHSVEM